MLFFLLRKANYCNTFQVAINKARQLNVTYIDVNKSNVLPHDVRICWGPFFLYQSRELSRFAGVKPVPFPVGSYVKYAANYYANSTFVHNLKHIPNLIMRKVLGAKNYSALKRILKKRWESFWFVVLCKKHMLFLETRSRREGKEKWRNGIQILSCSEFSLWQVFLRIILLCMVDFTFRPAMSLWIWSGFTFCSFWAN